MGDSARLHARAGWVFPTPKRGVVPILTTLNQTYVDQEKGGILVEDTREDRPVID